MIRIQLNTLLLNLLMVSIFTSILAACTQNDVTADHNRDDPQGELTTYALIEEARMLEPGVKFALEPVHTIEFFRISGEELEMMYESDGREPSWDWDEEGIYGFFAYDQESTFERGNLALVYVRVSDLEELFRGNDFLRIEGEWIESDSENTPNVLLADKIKVIDPVEDWDARPGDI